MICVQNNQKQTDGGRGEETKELFQPLTFTCLSYKVGLWGGLCSTLPAGLQTFWVIFCHVVILQEATVQIHSVKYSMLLYVIDLRAMDLW